jgi:hypothetical protein
MPKEQSSSSASMDSKTYDVSHHEYSENPRTDGHGQEMDLPTSKMSYAFRRRGWRAYRYVFPIALGA